MRAPILWEARKGREWIVGLMDGSTHVLEGPGRCQCICLPLANQNPDPMRQQRLRFVFRGRTNRLRADSAPTAEGWMRHDPWLRVLLRAVRNLDSPVQP